MSTLPFAADAPVHVAKVGLRGRDAEALAAFYRHALGLAELSRRNGTIALGAGGRELLEIEAAPSAEIQNPRSAGLFHTAFLLPKRSDLARWVQHAADKKIAITGASDHNVSEALYLDDPEGNGIEIYVDRPREAWTLQDGMVAMSTERLDLPGLLSTLDEDGRSEWNGAPEHAIIGHVHLRVGDTPRAETWWNGEMGFDTVARYGGAASFLSTGGYHHHIGVNSWKSAGAGRRSAGHTGLTFVELASRQDTESTVRLDPWGTEIRVKPV